ncbi:MAG TPA: zinc dependent phospholipase C family protein [Desulfuromonadales bacterium]|nr:zinc dependent phospholipase C family protein [Desulfuromonadales bacterium]
MLLLLTAVAVMLFPTDALAWGGGVHLMLGANVLANPAALSPPLAALLTSFPRDFLYGCIAADITLGKKFTHYLLNCHRWGIGLKILKKASTDGQRACAYGYLCHLAADTVAHNYYVPYKIIRSFATVTMKHAYWEMRFETFVDKQIWELANEVCKADQQANDKLLRSVLAPTIFSFGTNKRIFNSIMLMSRLEKWQQVMQTLSNNSRYQLSVGDRDEYLQLAQDAVLSFLQRPEGSDLLHADPTGEKALAAADALRKNLRLLYKNGQMTKDEGFVQVEALRSTLRKSLHEPALLKDLYNG